LLYVLPVCYDVRLLHLNKEYLLTYLLTYLRNYIVETAQVIWSD